MISNVTRECQYDLVSVGYKFHYRGGVSYIRFLDSSGPTGCSDQSSKALTVGTRWMPSGSALCLRARLGPSRGMTVSPNQQRAWELRIAGQHSASEKASDGEDPFMSPWPSAANTWAGAARGFWTAEMHRQQSVGNEVNRSSRRAATGSARRTRCSLDPIEVMRAVSGPLTPCA